MKEAIKAAIEQLVLAKQRMEREINQTPTGDHRNHLTELNIKLLLNLESLEELYDQF